MMSTKLQAMLQTVQQTLPQEMPTTRLIHKLEKSSLGLSLVELMVAVALGSFLTLGLIQVFVSNKQAVLVQQNLSAMSENARMTMHWISHDVRMAGQPDSTYETWKVRVAKDASGDDIPIVVTDTCFSAPFEWAIPQIPVNNFLPPKIFGADDAVDPNNTNIQFNGCIKDKGANGVATALQYGTGDILSIHYVDSRPHAVPVANINTDLAEKVHYINPTLNGGIVFKCPDGASSVACLPADSNIDANKQSRKVISRVYYVNNSNQLSRYVLTDIGDVQNEVLLDNIYDFQVLYGVDTNNNGVANQFNSADEIYGGNNVFQIADIDAWNKVVSVRFAVLIRSPEAEAGYTDPNTNYVLLDDPNSSTTPVAGYHYQVYTTTISLRNKNT